MTMNIMDNPVANFIAMVIVLLMAIGTVFVFSAGADIGLEFDLQKFYSYPGLRQIMFLPLACLIMYTASCIDYRRFSMDKGWLRNPVVYLLALSIILLTLVLSQRFFPVFPNLVPLRNDHYRWLAIPVGSVSISFQPSELAKWTTIFFIAAACSRFGDDIKLFWKRFIPLCIVVSSVVGLIIVEDFGTAALISLLAFLMFLIGGVKLWHVLPPLPIAGAAFYVAITQSPMRVQRIKAFLNPEKWTDSFNYQPYQSLIAIGSGGIWGKGLGKGISKYGHLPFDETDFIFSIVGEELGFAGNVAIIMLFVIFLILGTFVVVRCRDSFGRLLAGGIVLAIATQAALNIGVVTVVLPTKGIPLPFVSAGGTSMLLSAAAIGVLINIARQTAHKPERVDENYSR